MAASPSVIPRSRPWRRTLSGTGADLAAHASADRTVAVLLVRLGGYAAGVFRGAPPRLVASKVGSRLVHGRSAAGGTSQHRFARRREKQAREALEAAADMRGGRVRPGQRRAGRAGAGRRQARDGRSARRCPAAPLLRHRRRQVPDRARPAAGGAAGHAAAVPRGPGPAHRAQPPTGAGLPAETDSPDRSTLG